MPSAYFYSSTAGSYTLTGSINSSATSIVLSSVTGLPASLPYKVVLDPGQGTEEIVKVTAVAGTTLTVVRGWDGSTASAHSAGATVRHMVTAEDLTLSRTHEAATSGVHGIAGTAVGTTDAQTLTNKNLTSGTNTFPSSLATLTTNQALQNKDLTHFGNQFPASLATLSTVQAITNKDLSIGNTFPTSLATLTGAQTLTNKSLTAPTLTGTTTAATITASGSITAPNLPASSSARAGSRLHWGSYSGTTNGTGQITVTHGCGFTPTGGAVTILSPLGSVVCTNMTSISSTQATLQFYFVSTGAVLNAQAVTAFVIWGE